MKILTKVQFEKESFCCNFLSASSRGVSFGFWWGFFPYWIRPLLNGAQNTEGQSIVKVFNKLASRHTIHSAFSLDPWADRHSCITLKFARQQKIDRVSWGPNLELSEKLMAQFNFQLNFHTTSNCKFKLYYSEYMAASAAKYDTCAQETGSLKMILIISSSLSGSK